MHLEGIKQKQLIAWLAGRIFARSLDVTKLSSRNGYLIVTQGSIYLARTSWPLPNAALTTNQTLVQLKRGVQVPHRRLWCYVLIPV